jgi:hypothetical protein
MKEELNKFYSVTLKLPLRPLCGVTVTRRKMQLLSSEHRLLCGTLKRSRLLLCNETIGECMEVMRLIRKPSRPGLTSSENPHIHREVIRDIPKVNVWCGLMKDTITGPFFFVEATVTGGVYLKVLEQFVLTQVAVLQPNIIYQQDGAPPHWSLHVRETLTRTFPDRWIGRKRPISWPPRSPDITSLDFIFWGYVKDRVYATRVPDYETASVMWFAH